MRLLSYYQKAKIFFNLLAFISVFLLSGCKEKEKIEDISSYPKVLDDRLAITQIDTSPNVMTPIGLTIDKDDNLYFLESHTHTPPKDYPGPQFDRIKKGVDENKDGIPEKWIIYADSILDGMNLWSDKDMIYLAQKNKVTAFQDTDNDGKSDIRIDLLTMTRGKNVYDHAGILGVTLSPDGWLYISRGNTGGYSWEIKGTDGSSLEGYGDGGNVMRCRPDGSNLEHVATGFWNPFNLKFSSKGKLLLTDNDPDSRGPNRLIDVVPGGVYGYQSIYGGSGVHPFLAWNGELPGTLPYAAALGEAPCDLLDASFTNFPEKYNGNIIAAIWEENNIVTIPLQERGISVEGKTEVLVQGDSSFHPVAFATNSKGEVYFTDWVVRQYPNHGEGKIWKLSTKENPDLNNRKVAFASLESSTTYFGDNNDLSTVDQLQNALTSNDKFLKARARNVLQKSEYETNLLSWITGDKTNLRLQSLLVFSKSEIPLEKEILQDLLSDENEEVRRMSLIYIAKKARVDLRNDVEKALANGKITSALFETYLSTIRHLQPAYIQGFKEQSEKSSKNLKRALPAGYLNDIVGNQQLSDAIRAEALPLLNNAEVDVKNLSSLLENSTPILKQSILQKFKSVRDETAANAILKTALNEKEDRLIRAQALVSLSSQPGNYCNEITELLKSGVDELIAENAIRYLCRCTQDEGIATNIKEIIQSKNGKGNLAEIWNFCSEFTAEGNRPQNDQSWETFLNEAAGDPVKGQFVFQQQRNQCQTCHKVNGWGGDFGPDLSHIGSSKSKKQIITAILEPSAEIAPEWQGWFVKSADGKIHYGRQIDVGFKNVELMGSDGEFVTYKEPLDYGITPSSLMPEGLENNLTAKELRDLIAYLTELK